LNSDPLLIGDTTEFSFSVKLLYKPFALSYCCFSWK
jgi:hypothetical protein